MAKTESKKAVTYDSKYTEDWVPIKSIMNGMVQLDNGREVPESRREIPENR